MRKDVFRYLFAILLAFGFAACDNGGSVSVNEDWGVFTLKDIPSEYNGKYAVIAENDAGLKVAGAQSIDMSNEKMIGAPVSGGTAQIPMWIINGKETARYTGSDSGKFSVWIYEKEIVPFDVTDDPDVKDSILLDITFSNGSGQKSYNDRTYDTGSLSLSGLDKYSGKYIFALAFLGSGENADALFAAESFDHDETFTNGLIDTSGNITLNVYKGTNTGSGFSIGGYKNKDNAGRIDMLILSEPTLSLTDLSEILPIMSNQEATEDEKAAVAKSIGLIYTVSHNPAGNPHFVDGDYTIGTDWEEEDVYGKVVITADVYVFQDDSNINTPYTGSVAEITARTVNPENTNETIKELGIVGSIKDGVLTIELPAELDDTFLFTDDEDGTITGVPGNKFGWVMFSPYLVFNKYWDDWGNDSSWMGTMPFYIFNNEDKGWFYFMNPVDHPEDGIFKPISDQDELIADGFYWQIREE